MALTSTRLTAEEYFALPPTEKRTQLIDGEVVVTEPSVRHQRIAAEIYRRLANWLDDHPGAGEAGIPVDVHLDDRNVFAPDVWWVPEEARPPTDAARTVGAPALAVEVRSPSTWRYDIGAKKAVYERSAWPSCGWSTPRPTRCWSTGGRRPTGPSSTWPWSRRARRR